MSGISPTFLQKSLELRDNTSSRKAAAKALKKAVKNYQQSEALPINEMNRLHPPGNFFFLSLFGIYKIYKHILNINIYCTMYIFIRNCIFEKFFEYISRETV
jgi:hypothetical protein